MAKKTPSPEPQQLVKLTVVVDTPIIGRYMSPTDEGKEEDLKQLVECYKLLGYGEETLKKVVHADRWFFRDRECNAFIPGNVLSGALRKALNDKSIEVDGALIIKADEVKKVITLLADSVEAGGEKSMTVYEAIRVGARLESLVRINKDLSQIKQPIIAYIGARREKGFGRVEIYIQPIK